MPTTPKAEKKTRVLSPEMVILRTQFKKDVAAMHHAKTSAATLAHITEKLLPKLTADDKTVLLNRISSPTK